MSSADDPKKPSMIIDIRPSIAPSAGAVVEGPTRDDLERVRRIRAQLGPHLRGLTPFAGTDMSKIGLPDSATTDPLSDRDTPPPPSSPQTGVLRMTPTELGVMRILDFSDAEEAGLLINDPDILSAFREAGISFPEYFSIQPFSRLKTLAITAETRELLSYFILSEIATLVHNFRTNGGRFTFNIVFIPNLKNLVQTNEEKKLSFSKRSIEAAELCMDRVQEKAGEAESSVPSMEALATLLHSKPKL